jgi:plasmid stabilization system protein ParE
MGYKVIWTKEALADIEAIAEYIEKDSFFYASSVVSKILDVAKFISTFPFSGRVVPEENNEVVREHFVYSYRVIYEIRKDTVYILAVVHGKRILPQEIKERRI